MGIKAADSNTLSSIPGAEDVGAAEVTIKEAVEAPKVEARPKLQLKCVS